MTDMGDQVTPPGADPLSSASQADADGSLLGLVDRLAAVLERSDLDELEIEVGGTALLLRKPAASSGTLMPGYDGRAAATIPAAVAASVVVGPVADAPPVARSVKAPLTGLFYSAPTPGSAPYVRVGGEVAVGQVIGLIEAMKLFNEIKSDLAGRVVRIAADNGALVKAKQPLIEVEPL